MIQAYRILRKDVIFTMAYFLITNTEIVNFLGVIKFFKIFQKNSKLISPYENSFSAYSFFCFGNPQYQERSINHTVLTPIFIGIRYIYGTAGQIAVFVYCCFKGSNGDAL